MKWRAGGRFLAFKAPALAYMAFIFFMSSGPITSKTLNEVPDYVLHALGYALLCLLLFWAIHEGVRVARARWGYWLPAVLTVLYGISDEFHQSFIPTRQSSISDVGADAVGALVGCPAARACCTRNYTRSAWLGGLDIIAAPQNRGHALPAKPCAPEPGITRKLKPSREGPMGTSLLQQIRECNSNYRAGQPRLLDCVG